MYVIDVLVVDDHEIVRQGVRRLLEEAGFSTAEASSGEDALQKLRQELRPRVILMDIHMPGMGGLESTQRILSRDPDMRVVVLTATTEGPLPKALLRAGAYGYLTKGCSVDEMALAMRRVMNGERHVSSEIAQSLALSLVDGENESPFDSLSTRELQFVVLLSQGLRNYAIAESMNISTKTVSTYRMRAFTKLGVASEAELIRLALEHGVAEHA